MEHPDTPTRVAHLYRSLMTCCGLLSALLFGLMALLVCLDVALRNLSTVSISWAVEMTEYMLMSAAFLAAPWLAYTNDHICVDVLVRGLPVAAKQRVTLLCNVICLLISTVLAFESAKSLLANAAQGGMIFKVLIFPEWWLAIPMTFCFALLSLEFLRRLLGGMSARWSGGISAAEPSDDEHTVKGAA